MQSLRHLERETGCGTKSVHCCLEQSHSNGMVVLPDAATIGFARCQGSRLYK